ncbi:MAG TPA: VOC family protein, partial [Myxococcaceae bacterium]|nr:VOC family protein [Myxococcaceae bacterium]
MEYRLELVVVPVTDVDRAKAFYADQVGFHVDVDATPAPGMRVVQLTPPGSGCSVTVGTGLTPMEPGSLKGLQLCVADIDASRAELAGRGVPVSAVRHHD